MVRNAESTATLVAGSGLSGGGPLNSGTDVTLNIGAGTGIIVGADSISFDTSVLASYVTGSGTSGRIPKFTGSGSIGNSVFAQGASSGFIASFDTTPQSKDYTYYLDGDASGLAYIVTSENIRDHTPFGLGLAYDRTNLQWGPTTADGSVWWFSGTKYWGWTQNSGTGVTTFSQGATGANYRFTTPGYTGNLVEVDGIMGSSGVSLRTTGTVDTYVGNGAAAYGLDLRDNIIRTQGYLMRHWNPISGKVYHVRTYDGRNSYGYGTATDALAGTILGFIQDDIYSDAGFPHQIGVLSLIQHSNTGLTITQAYGTVGVYSLADSTALTARVFAGVHGNISSTTDTALTGKIAAAVSGSLWHNIMLTSTSNGVVPTYPDLILRKATVPLKGSFDHVTVFWANLYGSATTNTPPTNKPAIVSSARIPIQCYPASVTIGSPLKENWGLYGEAPSTGTNDTGTAGTAIFTHYPAVTGFMRVPYPRFTAGTGTNAKQIYWEPWDHKATTGRANAIDGDTYFSDGVTNLKGLWEYAGAWQKLLQYTQTDAIAGTGGALCYASVYGNEIAWSQSAAQNTWYEISDTDMTDGQLGNGATHDGSGKITVPNAGLYKIAYSITFELGGANKHIEAAISISGTEQAPGQTHLETSAANLEHSFSSVAILSLSAGATVEVSIRQTDTGSTTITVDDVNLSVLQLTGSPATLAGVTGGATGPTTAAQSKWAKVVCLDGTAGWVPVWV